jgi:hypothetical protein
VGQYLDHAEVRKRFAKPLSELSSDFDRLCKRWKKAFDSDQIVRDDLLLNDVSAAAALNTLRKFLREASGKLDDAIAGVYRYRDVERRRAAERRKRGDSQA